MLFAYMYNDLEMVLVFKMDNASPVWKVGKTVRSLDSLICSCQK